MKKAGVFFICILMLNVLALLPSRAFAAYQLTEVSAAWDGTDENRLKAPTADYDYTYGDEAGFTYTLPWQVSFFGQVYSQINVDTNGNVWFRSYGSAHSFNLLIPGRGPVIAGWNNDLSSYYYGGAFVQHKTNPERVVIEWQTETYLDEGFYRPNTFEVVLFKTGDIRFDYKTFNASAGKDFGSGISAGDGYVATNLTSNYGNVYTLAGRSFLFNGTPKISVTPNSFVTWFGPVNINEDSSPIVFTAQNVGNGSLIMGLATITGINSDGQFRIVSDGCAGQILDSMASCPIQVVYHPTLTYNGSAYLNVESNDPSMPITKRLILGQVVAPFTLIVNNTGTGAGMVTSTPSGIACNTNCSGAFPPGTQVTLHPAASPYSLFSGWTNGACSVMGDCVLTLNADTSVTAVFDKDTSHQVLIDGSYYSTIQGAYNAAADGTTLKLWGINYDESLILDRSITTTLQGGYDSGYASRSGETVLNGSLTIIDGTAIIDGLTVK